MTAPLKAFQQAIEALLVTDSRSAVKYVSEKLVVKATRRMSRKRRGPFLGDNHETLLVTFGRPNYRERLFVKKCKKAGAAFPVKKVQLRGWPNRKCK